MKSASEMKRKQNRLRVLKRLAEKVSENHQVHVEQNRTGSSIMEKDTGTVTNFRKVYICNQGEEKRLQKRELI